MAGLRPGALGHSLELRDGDLVVGGGRMAEVAGPANLVQALTLRLLTPLGSDRFCTTYGFDAADVFTRAVDTRTALAALRLNVVRTIGTDPRVSEVRAVAVLDPPAGVARRYWQAVATVVAVSGTAQTVAVQLEAGG
jgi:hypothetical protein